MATPKDVLVPDIGDFDGGGDCGVADPVGPAFARFRAAVGYHTAGREGHAAAIA